MNHYPDGHNVGLGMVPHKKGCQCDECRIEKLEAKLAAQERELATVKNDIVGAVRRTEEAQRALQQARGEALRYIAVKEADWIELRIAGQEFIGVSNLDAWADAQIDAKIHALKPSPSGEPKEQINAAGSPKQPAVEQADVPRGQSVDDQQNDVASPAAPNAGFDAALEQTRQAQARGEALEEWSRQVRLIIRGIDGQAKRLTHRSHFNGETEEIISGYQLNTGLWHRLLGLLANCPASEPSPGGEQINAAGAHIGAGNITAQSSEPPPAALSTAPQAVISGDRFITHNVSVGTERVQASPATQEPAAAVPDDPVLWYLGRLTNTSPRYADQVDAKLIRALAAHYEAKGVRRAAEVCKARGYGNSPLEQEARHCAASILAAAKQEADR